MDQETMHLAGIAAQAYLAGYCAENGKIKWAVYWALMSLFCMMCVMR